MANHLPNRLLHAMLRVSDLEASVKFYCELLGMKEHRREVYNSGGYSLSFIGYDEEDANTVLELTYNHDQRGYSHGERFGHIAFEVEDIDAVFQHLIDHDVRVLRQPGPMADADQNGKRDVIAFVEDPDGYRIELIAKI